MGLSPVGYALVGAAIVVVLIGIGYLADWGLRKRLRQALEQRGRDENRAAQRLELMGGRSRLEGWDPPGWLEDLERKREEAEVGVDAGGCEDCDDD
jgi:hypothetical protein